MTKRYTFRAIAGAYYAFMLGQITATVGEVSSTAGKVFSTWDAAEVVVALALVIVLAYWAGQESRTDYSNR